MTRNVKRVDYKNIKPINVGDSSSDENRDESDDDFVASLTPPKKKKTKTTKTKKNDLTINKDSQKADALQLEPRKRKTRTSNVESCFEQDLLTAIEISQNGTENYDSKYDDEDDFDSPSHNIKNHLNKRSGVGKKEKECKENFPVDTTSGANVSDDNTINSERGSSLSEKDTPKLTSSSTNIALPALKKGSLSSKSTNPSIIKTMPLTPKVTDNKGVRCKVLTPDISTTSISKSKAMTPTQLTSSAINTKVSTPGRLRLGLSRNIRIAKPLHSNVTI